MDDYERRKGASGGEFGRLGEELSAATTIEDLSESF